MDFSNVLTDTYTLALLCIVAATLIFLSLYYGLYYFRVPHFKNKSNNKKANEDSSLPPVSVVMLAQNDAEWLRANLVYLLEQDYPNFEVVVVDYKSSDDTGFVLKLLAENYNKLKIVTFLTDINLWQGKKYPLSIGIKSAKNDVLLLADPECMPRDLENFSWMREMVKCYQSNKTSIVLGYCAINQKTSLFNWLQQYDNLDFSISYMGAALMHHPYTGSGRNLSYKRSLFMKNNGFIYHYNVPDGADDMFVNQNSTAKNTTVALDPSAFTTTEPQPSFRTWHLLRKHRTVTHKYYKPTLKAKLAARPICVALFYTAIVLLILAGTFPWMILAGVVALKWAWQIVCMAQSCKKFFVQSAVYWLSPLLEIYFLIANTILALIPLSKKNRI